MAESEKQLRIFFCEYNLIWVLFDDGFNHHFFEKDIVESVNDFFITDRKDYILELCANSALRFLPVKPEQYLSYKKVFLNTKKNDSYFIADYRESRKRSFLTVIKSINKKLQTEPNIKSFINYEYFYKKLLYIHRCEFPLWSEKKIFKYLQGGFDLDWLKNLYNFDFFVTDKNRDYIVISCEVPIYTPFLKNHFSQFEGKKSKTFIIGASPFFSNQRIFTGGAVSDE